MTIRDRIKNDDIGMRWIRTAATTITSIATAGAVLFSASIWLVGPRFVEWTESLVREVTMDLRSDFEALDDVVERLEITTAQLAETSILNPSPSWRFDPVETTVTDGFIGGIVTIRASGYKVRDCGVPTVDLYFVNGDGVFHRFEDVSLLSSDGRGVALPVQPNRLQSLSYVARIPSSEGVQPGRAQAYMSVYYPDACPAVPTAIAGPLQFRIMEAS